MPFPPGVSSQGPDWSQNTIGNPFSFGAANKEENKPQIVIPLAPGAQQSQETTGGTGGAAGTSNLQQVQQLDEANKTVNNNVTNIQNGAGTSNQVFGHTRGKSVDDNVKAKTNMSMDPKGNPMAVSNTPDGGTMSITDKGNNQFSFTSTDKAGNKTVTEQRTDADGGILVDSNTQRTDGTSSQSSFNYDKDGKVQDGVTTERDANGNATKVINQTRDAKGRIVVETLENGKSVSTERFDENGKKTATLNKETNKFEDIKEEHNEGSLGDIKDKKQALVDKQKGAAEQKLGEKSEKFQRNNEKIAKTDAKIKELEGKQNKTPEEQKKLDELKAGKTKLEARKDAMINKTAEKMASKGTDYQELSAKEEKEQKIVDQYKDFNLTDKDGKKLTAEQISDRKDELFKDVEKTDKDGNVTTEKVALSRKELEEKGVKKEYSEEAIANNPSKVLNDKEASKDEKKSAMMSQMMQMFGMKGGGSSTNNALKAFTELAINFSNNIGKKNSPQLSLASKRHKK